MLNEEHHQMMKVYAKARDNVETEIVDLQNRIVDSSMDTISMRRYIPRAMLALRKAEVLQGANLCCLCTLSVNPQLFSHGWSSYSR